MLLRAPSIADTHAIASVLAALARPGDIIVLAGEMGAGKTAFAQGFGRALGVTETITSPTFTLVHSYPCPEKRMTLHHADIYRLDNTVDVDELALHELAEFGGIVLVEWGDVAAAALGDHLEVRLSPDDEEDEDENEMAATGSEGQADEPDDFGLDGARTIEVTAAGRTWAGRWNLVTDGLAAYRC